ncbi:hypothetical protein [Nocardia sp. NBC_00511]|uniref:hypothetical protein n=1 Tax=Nocardia sp. NBC_00511 TaxID=2903591 RepID=UPI0030E04D6F
MTESLSSRMDRLADSVTSSHVSLSSDGISVDVRANGHVIALTLDDATIPDGQRLGPMIAGLINQARDRAQAQVEHLATEVQADPRVATIVERLGDTPERESPHSAREQWDEDYSYQRKSPVFDD